MRDPQLFLVGFCALPVFRPGSTFQLIIGFVFSLIVLLFTSITRPFQCSGHDEFSLLCNFSLVMVFYFSLVSKLGVLSEDVEESNLLSDQQQDSYNFDPALLSVAIICSVLAAAIVGLVGSVLAVYPVYLSTRAAARAAAAEREASIARGRLFHPPTTSWELRQGNRYCVFLSHCWLRQRGGSAALFFTNFLALFSLPLGRSLGPLFVRCSGSAPNKLEVFPLSG